MPESPEISVILPVYNAEMYLGEAIQSILDQTFRGFELIIINDGSTDRSDEIIRSFNDKRIIYLVNPQNLGLIKTLNRGWNQARGRFIARMDADDISLPRRLEIQLEAFTNAKDVQLVASDYFQMKEKRLSWVKNPFQGEELKALLLFAPSLAHPAVMFKNVSQHTLRYDESYPHAEDYKLWIDMTAFGDFYNVAVPLLKYRSHPSQISMLHSDVQKQSSEKLRELFLRRKGFVFSNGEIRHHHLVGNNAFITKKGEIEGIEGWLLSLIKQNRILKAFGNEEFAAVISKLWRDSCGHSNLGLFAFRAYCNSDIRRIKPASFREETKLFFKCLLRRFRRS